MTDTLIGKIANDIHYPEHWDTMAYPTVLDAIHEMTGSLFKCSECNPVSQREIPETDCPECLYKKMRKICVDMQLDPDKLLNKPLSAPMRESGEDWKQIAFKYGKLVRSIGHNINNEASKAPMKIDREYLKATAHHLWQIANYLDGTDKHESNSIEGGAS